MTCSTPFGIKDQVTPSIPSGHIWRAMCSTPFGIKDQVTRLTSQRRNCYSQCSTPFGIKDQVTDPGPHPPHQRRVLNAFRHQRSGHDHSWVENFYQYTIVLNAFRHQRSGHAIHPQRPYLAGYVLNAFRHQRSGHLFSSLSWPRERMSAQRLSASKIRSR